MNKNILFIVLLILAVAFVINSYKTAPSKSLPPLSTQLEELDADKLWNLVNEYRLSKNLSAFIRSQTLCELASKRLQEIKINNSHKGFWTHTEDFPNKELSENLASGYFSETETLEAWLNSPSHRKAIETSYKYSCIKTADTYAVQIFANF